ncbi:MAG: WYL domain-containing protein [Clostridia bacterium]|nr:WYL domain-containing protein [Clostridia bacterium]
MSNKETDNSTDNMTRLTPLMIYKLLKDESSKDHPLTTGYILSYLEEKGMKITRQTMYKDMELLQQTGFDVVCVRSRSNLYYLEQTDFNVAEQRILLDAIQAAHFITENMTKTLMHKVAALNGDAEAQGILSSILPTTNVKFEDKHVYYYISNIAEAISHDRKISFYYFDYNEKRQKKYRKDKQLYIENPVGTVCSGNNYYLVVYNEKHDKIINYRIDRMDSVNMCREMRHMPLNIEERTKEYLTSQFSMFAGKEEKVSIESSSQHINSILDMFSDAKFMPAPEGKVRFSAKVQLSPTFYSWIAGFNGDMKILSPSTTAKEFCEFLGNNLTQYPVYAKRVASQIESSPISGLEPNKIVLECKRCKSAVPGHRGPGRPRKNPLSADLSESGTDLSATPAPAADAVPAAPRKRGRPPKKRPEPVSEEPASPADSAEPTEASAPVETSEE